MIFVTFRWYAEDANVHSRDSPLLELDYIEFIRRFRFSKPIFSRIILSQVYMYVCGWGYWEGVSVRGNTVVRSGVLEDVK